MFIIAICSSLSIFTNSKFISFGLFYLALSGNDYALLTILCIDMPFIYLSSFEPNLWQYLNPYLVSISNILIRVSRIVFTSGLRLIFKPYLTRIWPVQSWNEWEPFASQSVLILLLVSHIHIPYQIVWERLTVKNYVTKLGLIAQLLCQNYELFPREIL